MRAGCRRHDRRAVRAMDQEKWVPGVSVSGIPGTERECGTWDGMMAGADRLTHFRPTTTTRRTERVDGIIDKSMGHNDDDCVCRRRRRTNAGCTRKREQRLLCSNCCVCVFSWFFSPSSFSPPHLLWWTLVLDFLAPFPPSHSCMVCVIPSSGSHTHVV